MSKYKNSAKEVGASEVFIYCFLLFRFPFCTPTTFFRIQLGYNRYISEKYRLLQTKEEELA